MWISKISARALEDTIRVGVGGDHATAVDLREALARVITHLGYRKESYTMPNTIEVYAECTDYRQDAWLTSLRPNIMEKEQYDETMKEVKPGSPTILYIHGGAFCLMDPTTHRWTTSALAQATGCRCLSIRQRLWPRSIVPAALLDALMAYLYLISPPLGSCHEADPASGIIIAGGSSGAYLCASLSLPLTALSRFNIPRLPFHDRIVTIPTPAAAGIVMTSPCLDVSGVLPSFTRNARFDAQLPTRRNLAGKSSTRRDVLQCIHGLQPLGESARRSPRSMEGRTAPVCQCGRGGDAG